MAIDTISHEQEEKAFDADLACIETALTQARAELSSITDAASTADSVTNNSDFEYSLHEVKGVGRYAVVRRTGWRALLDVIHDPAANIDFSTKEYPVFDGVIAENFKSPYMLDPLHEKYESFGSLRDNISAVRNFLMETYYVDTPDGMTPEKASQSLKEIAAFVGKGLDNNYIFMGLLPNHRSGKPFIDLERAKEPGGAGAQYIYERILEMQRQSSWMRPFAAVLSLFGGHQPPDWMLPPAHETEFTWLHNKDIAPDGAAPKGPSSDLLKTGVAAIESIEAERTRLIDQHEISNVAHDLNSLGDQLAHSAGNMQNVTQLSEPVRRDAIEIAKDILRKLRVGFGDIDIKNGLNLPPKEDLSSMGALKGVAMIYERMVGYARMVDASIMQHPNVIAGVQSIGQLGYLAKMEALRLAKVAGNTSLANEIGEQLAKMPEAYRSEPGTKFSQLLDRIEAGMNTMLSRVQTISGPSAQIGHTQDSRNISHAPTAGMGQQNNNTGNQADAAKQNAERMAAQNAFDQMQAARARQQNNRTQTTTTTTSTTQNQQSSSQQRSGSSITRSIFQSRSSQQRQQSNATSNRSSATVVNSSIRSASKPPSADMARLARIQQEQQHNDDEVRLQQQRVADMQRKAAHKAVVKADAKMAAKKIDPNLLKGFQSAINTSGMGPVVSAKKPIEPTQQQPSFVSQTQKSTNPLDDKNHPPTIPPHGRGGRSF